MSAEAESSPVSQEHEVAANRTKRIRKDLVIIAAVAVAVAAFFGYFYVKSLNTAEAAVREYAQLIESGRVEEATKLVPLDVTSDALQSPLGLLQPLDLQENDQLVSDDFYQSARAKMVVDDVRPTYSSDDDASIGNTVSLTVSYTVGTRWSQSELDVKRVADNWLGFPQWQIVDSLALAVHVPVLSAVPETLDIEGVSIATGPTWNDDYQIYNPTGPVVASYLYPGIYALGGDSQKYTTIAPQLMVVAESSSRNADDAAGGVVDVTADFEATPALYELLNERIAEQSTLCTTVEGFKQAETDGNECPYLFNWVRDRYDAAQTGTVTTMPIVSMLFPAPGYSALNSGTPMMTFNFVTAPGLGQTTDRDGQMGDPTAFSVQGFIYVSGDDVRVVFTR